MCDLIEPQPAEKIGKMKKLRRTLSESFSRIALKKDDTTFDEQKKPPPKQRTLTELEKIFICHISDKKPITKTYKELTKLNNKKTDNFTPKWGEDIFTIEEIKS